MSKPPNRKPGARRSSPAASNKRTQARQGNAPGADTRSKKRKPLRYRPQKSPRLRCFFGIRFTLADEIAAMREELSALRGDSAEAIRLAPDQNLHITLKFLGSVEESNLPILESILKEVALRHGPMALHASGAGVFKNSCWVGIDEDAGLTKLAQDLDTACMAVGALNEDKAYLPHVTVARFGKDVKPKLSALLEKFAEHKWGTIKVDQICLYRSDTLAEGARYTVISEAKLDGEKALAAEPAETPSS